MDKNTYNFSNIPTNTGVFANILKDPGIFPNEHSYTSVRIRCICIREFLNIRKIILECICFRIRKRLDIRQLTFECIRIRGYEYAQLSS